MNIWNLHGTHALSISGVNIKEVCERGTIFEAHACQISIEIFRTDETLAELFCLQILISQFLGLTISLMSHLRTLCRFMLNDHQARAILYQRLAIR